MNLDWFRIGKKKQPEVSVDKTGLGVVGARPSNKASDLEKKTSGKPAEKTNSNDNKAYGIEPTQTSNQSTGNKTILPASPRKRLDDVFYMVHFQATSAGIPVVLLNTPGDHPKTPRIITLTREIYMQIKDELPKEWKDDPIFDEIGFDLSKYGGHVRRYSPGLLNVSSGKKATDTSLYDELPAFDMKTINGKKHSKS